MGVGIRDEMGGREGRGKEGLVLEGREGKGTVR